jgi:uncharacterized protein
VSAASGTTNRFEIVLSDDRYDAWVQLHGVTEANYQPPTAEELFAALDAIHVVLDDACKAQVSTAAASIPQTVAAIRSSGSHAPPDPIRIVTGRRPVEAENGRVDWAPEFAELLKPPGADEQIDYYSRNVILTVPADTKVGRMVAPKEGVPGVDLLGKPHPPKTAKGSELRLGPGVRRAAEDSDEIVTTAAGRVFQDGDTLRVSEVLAITSDVNLSTGSVQSCVDVTVGGAIRALLKVHTTKSLTVHKVIEAAHVEAGGDITVFGGVFGQDGAGHVRAGGQLAAKLLNEVDVRAGGDIRFEKEILNCRVRTDGAIVGKNGTLIGGDVYAREGIDVRIIGSEACVTTLIAVGIDVNVLRRIRQLERRMKEFQKSADQIRQAVSPLLANLKRLVPVQRERATELLCKADEVEMQIDGMREQAQQMLEAAKPRGKPHIVVSEALYPGTRLIVEAHEVKVHKVLHGPVRIELRKVDDVTQVVTVNQRTGSVLVLLSHDADLEAPPTDEEPTSEQGHEPRQPAARHPGA